MKLCCSPDACLLSPHIALGEAGLGFDPVEVNLATEKTDTGSVFLAANPSGSAPCPQLDRGRSLIECPATVQCVADQAPRKKLASANGSFGRYQLRQWPNFISTEIRKACSPPVDPATGGNGKTSTHKTPQARIGTTAAQLPKAPCPLGETFMVADIYLFVVLSWSSYVGVDLSSWPAFWHFMARAGDCDAAQAAVHAEGLVQG